ncbi:hypothetical protein ACFQ9X_56030 [Catenulispora yoronensis]
MQGGPSGGQSAGYVKDQLKDPRITITIGIKGSGTLGGIQPPTAGQLLTNEQLLRITGNAAFVQYATTQWAHYLDLENRLRVMTPPSATGSTAHPPYGTVPTSISAGDTVNWPTRSSDWQSSGPGSSDSQSSGSQPSGPGSSASGSSGPGSSGSQSSLSTAGSGN